MHSVFLHYTGTAAASTAPPWSRQCSPGAQLSPQLPVHKALAFSHTCPLQSLSELPKTKGVASPGEGSQARKSKQLVYSKSSRAEGRLGWRCCGREADGADKPTASYTRALPLKEPHGQMAAEEPRGTQRGDCPEDMDCPRNVCT